MENINGESASVVVGLIASCLAILQSKQEVSLWYLSMDCDLV